MGVRARVHQPKPEGATSSGPLARKLKKGELLFAEGENSRAMYLLKSGMVRIFKKKGDALIEIDTVRSGQILGELAFLDGNPRSASGEALTDCDLLEISGPTFQNVLSTAPDWLKLLLKTVVGRLRTASTRIRQLETSSTAYDFDKDGKRSAHYVYLSSNDVLKICSALLLVAARNGTPSGKGIDIRVSLLQRYANQVMGVPVAKITSLLDVLAQVGVVSLEDETGAPKVSVLDIDLLEKYIAWQNEENLLEPTKRHDLTLKSFLIMGLVAKHLDKFPKDPDTGLVTVNLAQIRKTESEATGRDVFRLEEFPELVKHGYASSMGVVSSEEVTTTVKADSFLNSYRMQRIVMATQVANEQKKKHSR